MIGQAEVHDPSRTSGSRCKLTNRPKSVLESSTGVGRAGANQWLVTWIDTNHQNRDGTMSRRDRCARRTTIPHGFVFVDVMTSGFLFFILKESPAR